MKTICGIVCWRDENGDMTGRITPITREPDESSVSSECGLTKSEQAFADAAVDFFANLLLKNPAAKEYLDGLKEKGNE